MGIHLLLTDNDAPCRPTYLREITSTEIKGETKRGDVWRYLTQTHLENVECCK